MIKEISKTVLSVISGILLGQLFIYGTKLETYLEYNKESKNKNKKSGKFQDNLIYKEKNLDKLPAQIQDQLCCPISYGYYKMPTTSPSGNTFDYDTIIDWLKLKKECPLTKTKLSSTELIPNENIIYAIKFFNMYSKEYLN